jgi:hypothetical protein
VLLRQIGYSIMRMFQSFVVVTSILDTASQKKFGWRSRLMGKLLLKKIIHVGIFQQLEHDKYDQNMSNMLRNTSKVFEGLGSV